LEESLASTKQCRLLAISLPNALVSKHLIYTTNALYLLLNSSSSGGGLRELLLRRELQNSMDATSPDPVPLGQSLPRSMLNASPGSLSPRLSSSAPSGQANSAWEAWQQRREAVWSRRDPRPHLISTGSLAEAGSTSSLVSAGNMEIPFSTILLNSLKNGVFSSGGKFCSWFGRWSASIFQALGVRFWKVHDAGILFQFLHFPMIHCTKYTFCYFHTAL